MSIITLMTDFGIKDGNVGVMKGIIYGIAPDARLVDLSHMIGAQNVREAAIVLARSAPFFPPGTVHMVVVDPGVGTARRPIAVKMGGQYYVGPDNGTLTFWLETLEQTSQPVTAVHLDKPAYWLKDVSYVFHGRDIFSPVAARLSTGTSLELMGSIIHDPQRISLPQPVRESSQLTGEVMHIDHFGNAGSNIQIHHLLQLLGQPAGQTAIGSQGDQREMINLLLARKDDLSVEVSGVTMRGLVAAFGERRPGEPAALISSTGSLFASVVNGSFAGTYGTRTGARFIVRVRG